MNLEAKWVAPQTIKWLATAKTCRIMSVFEHVCNLVDNEGHICALVTPAAGMGPFAIEISKEINFLSYIGSQPAVSLQNQRLMISPLTINLTKVMLWSAQPKWQTVMPAKMRQYAPLIETLLNDVDHISVVLTEFADLKTAVHYLAGRGIGLTPAGDDFLMGMIYALWILRPTAVVTTIAQMIFEEAAPRTTTLSARWLQAAQSGEAHISWHNLVCAFEEDQPAAVVKAVQAILAIGHSSGADALSGFVTTVRAILSNNPAANFWQISD